MKMMRAKLMMVITTTMRARLQGRQHIKKIIVLIVITILVVIVVELSPSL